MPRAANNGTLKGVEKIGRYFSVGVKTIFLFSEGKMGKCCVNFIDKQEVKPGRSLSCITTDEKKKN